MTVQAKRETKKTMTRNWVLTLLLILIPVSFLLAQTKHTSGVAILDVGNKRDIYDQKNRDALLKLKQEAVIDAIEKVAAIDISVRTELSTVEQQSNGQNAFNEQFVNGVLQRYNVKWTRDGDYLLERDPERKRVWICRVSGKVELGDAFKPDEAEIATRPFVRAKQGKYLYCTDGSTYDLRVGDRVEVLKQRAIDASGGSIIRNKVVGRAVVTETQDRSATAQVISGRFGIKDGYLLRKGDFPLISGGLKVGLFLADERVSFKETSDQGVRNVSGVSIEYYELSLTKHYGVLFGIDIINDNIADTLSPTSATMRFGVMRPVALIPEYFHVTPSMSLGAAFLSEEYGLSEKVKFLFQFQLEAGIRMGILELGAGLRYNYIGGFDPLSNVYPIASISINFMRFNKQANSREAPGFGVLMNMMQ